MLVLSRFDRVLLGIFLFAIMACLACKDVSAACNNDCRQITMRKSSASGTYLIFTKSDCFVCTSGGSCDDTNAALPGDCQPNGEQFDYHTPMTDTCSVLCAPPKNGYGEATGCVKGMKVGTQNRWTCQKAPPP